MDDTTNEIKSFLKECNELLFPTSDANINPKIVGNYALNRQDVAAQVIDWILHYLEDRKCPYPLAVAVAKETAQQIENSLPEPQLEENTYDQEKALNSLMLYNETMKKLATVCRSFMNEINDSTFITSSPYMASVFAIKNKRRKMEDRHVIHHDLNLLLDVKDAPPHSYYAVFDGHSGVDAASYASAHLHINIANHPDFLTDTTKAIAEAYKITDDNFFKKCQEQNLKSGTTAICALIREKTVYLSWVGDSQAVLVKDGKPLIVTSPHKPERQDEKQRIENLGGCISFFGTWRVNGMLAVTRAIGDPDHKPYISSEPEITVIDLDGNEDFLILACDGLWDTMSPDDVISALYNNLSQSASDEPVDAIAAKLVHQSKLQGSEDNITAVVVFLKDITDIKEHAPEYVRNVSESNFNSSNVNINGEEKSATDIKTNYPLTKPTELDLNATSSKKVKNAGLIPNASCFEGNSFGFSFPENAAENLSFHPVNIENCDENMFSLQQSAKSYYAPETTALSELPTPPIDDLAAQQFQAEVDAISSNVQTSDSPSPSRTTDSNVFSQGLLSALDSENFVSKDLSVDHISPTEAVDIASSVVSNTIETAVKCLSTNHAAETIMHVSSQKLNPYAEPFVMKSFVTENVQSISDNTSLSLDSVSDITHSGTFGDSDLHSETKMVLQNFESNLHSEIVMSANVTEVIENVTQTELLLKEKDQITIANVSVDNQNLLDDSFENFKNSEANKESLFITSENMSGVIPVTDEIISNINMPTEIAEFSLLVSSTKQSRTPEIIAAEDISMPKLVKESISGISVPLLASENFPTQEPSILHTNFSDEAIEKSIFPSLPKQQTNESLNLDISNQEPHTEIELLPKPLPEFQSNINVTNVSENNANPLTNPVDIKANVENSESVLKSSNLSSISASLDQNLQPIDTTPGLDQSSHIHNTVPEPSSTSEVNVSSLPSNSESCAASEPSIILDGIALPLTDMKESLLPTTAILPSEQLDDSHTEAVAVDLQTVPVGIPEAEGVTEDIDSDSEKDGGWSYMKGNTVGSTKHKTAATSSSTTKPSGQSDNLKLKKEALNSACELKNKGKNLGNIDKNKKILEKKSFDLKDKSKSTKSAIVKGVPEKSLKVAPSTKKEVVNSKISNYSASKISKTATSKSTVSQIKSGSSISSRNLTKSSSINNGVNFKPKSSSNEVKRNESPITSTPLVKKQPINQGIKSSSTITRTNVTSLNRPVSSTVPNRATTLGKSTLTKTAPLDSKSRPNTALKRTVPPSTLKKPDVKETKDITNKQIVEKKTAVSKVSSKISVSSSASTLKPAASLSSRSVVTTLGSSLKNAVKKDVPKTSTYRPANKNQFSKDALKTKEKNPLTLKNKFPKKSNLEVKASENTVAETTPSEEEKFIREVNDKEVATKELIDITTNSVQEKIPTENGCSIETEVKQLEDVIVNTSESLL